MKFIWFAFTLCFGLLGVTAFIAWRAHIEAREARKEVLMFRQQQNEQIAAGATPMPSILESPQTAPALIPPPPPHSQLPPPAAAVSAAPPSAVITPPAAQAPAPAAPAPLTAQQSHLLTLPAIAKIKEAHLNEGFVLIDAGTARNMAAGMKFDLRRGASLVGRVTLTDAIEATEAIADIQPMSVPIGVEPQPGDELVQISPPP